MAKSIRVVTYNVLSPPLCSKKWFPLCSEENLDEATRFEVSRPTLDSLSPAMRRAEPPARLQTSIPLIATQWLGSSAERCGRQTAEFTTDSYTVFQKGFLSYESTSLAIMPNRPLFHQDGLDSFCCGVDQLAADFVLFFDCSFFCDNSASPTFCGITCSTKPSSACRRWT